MRKLFKLIVVIIIMAVIKVRKCICISPVLAEKVEKFAEKEGLYFSEAVELLLRKVLP